MVAGRLTPTIGYFPNVKKILEEIVIFKNNISTEEINSLDTGTYSGRIWVIEDAYVVDEAVRRISQHNVIGFDTETRPSFKKGKLFGLSLIQLATPNEVFLIRTIKTGIPDSLVELFSNEEIIKVGIAIRDDVRKMQKLKNFHSRGFLELQEYSNFFKIEDNSLRKLSAIVLGIKVSKTQQLSNWEAEVLTEAQINYAATDAWVCLEIYNKLKKSANNYGTGKNNTEIGKG
jgi:ribonuclease D